MGMSSVTVIAVLVAWPASVVVGFLIGHNSGRDAAYRRGWGDGYSHNEETWVHQVVRGAGPRLTERELDRRGRNPAIFESDDATRRRVADRLIDEELHTPGRHRRGDRG